MVHYSKHDVMGTIDAKCAECHTTPQMVYFSCNVCGTVLCGNCMDHARACKRCGENIAKTTTHQQQSQSQVQHQKQR